MTLMKLGILVLLLAGVACAPPPSIVTPRGHVAYGADQIVVRINELQNAAISANAAGGLDINTTRRLVEFVVTADRTLAATPGGWLNTVTAAWAQTKRDLPAVTNIAVLAAMGAVDAVLTAGGTR